MTFPEDTFPGVPENTRPEAPRIEAPLNKRFLVERRITATRHNAFCCQRAHHFLLRQAFEMLRIATHPESSNGFAVSIAGNSPAP